MAANKGKDTMGAGVGRTLTRRGFVELAGGVAAAGGMLALAGCSSTSSSSSSDSAATTESASTSGDDSTIRFGCEAAYAPYEWKQDDSNDYTLPISNLDGAYTDGYDIQLMKMIAKEMDREPVVVNISFQGLIAALQNGEIDAICSGMSATDERKESVDFSDPYLHSGVGIMVKKDSDYADATSLDDFAGASMVAQKSSLPDQVIDQVPDVVHLDPVDSIPDALARLEAGTVDAVTVDANNKDLYEKTYTDCVVIVFDDGKGFDTPGVDPAVAVQKGDPEGLLDSINKVIDGLSDDDRQKLWDECSERAPE